MASWQHNSRLPNKKLNIRKKGKKESLTININHNYFCGWQ